MTQNTEPSLTLHWNIVRTRHFWSFIFSNVFYMPYIYTSLRIKVLKKYQIWTCLTLKPIVKLQNCTNSARQVWFMCVYCMYLILICCKLEQCHISGCGYRQRLLWEKSHSSKAAQGYSISGYFPWDLLWTSSAQLGR